MNTAMNTNACVEQISMVPGDGWIALPEIPTSGYRWNLVHVPRGVDVVGDDFTLKSGHSGAQPKLGGGGIRSFRVHVDDAGVYELQFVRKRAWEAKPIEERTVRLNVTTPERRRPFM
jgi:predicted secreted protein